MTTSSHHPFPWGQESAGLEYIPHYSNNLPLDHSPGSNAPGIICLKWSKASLQCPCGTLPSKEQTTLQPVYIPLGLRGDHGQLLAMGMDKVGMNRLVSPHIFLLFHSGVREGR